MWAAPFILAALTNKAFVMRSSNVSWTAGLLLWSAGWSAADSTTTFVNPDVSTGAPFTGNYTGQYRPQVHFSPPQFFMNDPNGMFRDENDTWHLYYQYNPTDSVAGNQHWGHATSRDLYHWKNQPIALYPPEEDVFVFSGSAVTDPDNTSGFFPNQTDGVVAIYVSAWNTPTLPQRLTYPLQTLAAPDRQTQAIAYSRDGGYTFTPYENNPVIPSDSAQFRDPKVIWHQDHWVMAVAYATDFAIGIFTSPNLIDWTPTSNFSHHGLIGLQYECPNMIRMPYIDEDGARQEDMWLMYISINPGAPLGGSIGQYFPGTFNGTHFEAVDAVTRIADFGKDNYAGQWFYGVPDDDLPVSIAWASNWQYTNTAPTAEEGWRSAMSLPRQNYLTKMERVGWKMVSKPYDMTPILGGVLVSNESVGNDVVTVDFFDVESNALYWEVDVTGIPKSGIPSTITLSFSFNSSDSGEYVRGGVSLGDDATLYLDRGGAKGFDNVFFTDKFSTNSIIAGSSWSMSGVIDRSMLELFYDGGLESATNTFFSTQPLTRAEFGTAGLPEGINVSLRVNALKSAWATR